MKSALKWVLASLYLISISAFAHADLAKSIPAAGAEVIGSPKSIQLEFNEAVRLAQLKLHKEDGATVQIDFKMSGESSKAFTAAVQEVLNDGRYTVYWVAMGSDSHKISGNFSFQVKS